MKSSNFFKNIKWGHPSVGQIIVILVGILSAVGAFMFVRGLVTCWTITPLPGSPPAACGTNSAGLDGPTITTTEGTPVPAVGELPPPPASIPESDLPSAWDGASRINILVIGLDYRDWIAGEGAPRSDTMIVLTIDPLSKTGGMLIIPRDMWVSIPGFGYSKINTAYSFGQGSQLPGGGPELAMKTVEQFLGVPIDYYAQIDFSAFTQFIDEIGGIWVYNDENLRLDPVGSGKKIKLTCCGMRPLNGAGALAYARCRYESQGCKDGDIGRARRTQKVILAIREKVLSPEEFPVLVGKAHILYEKLSAGIHTDMPFDTALRLGILAKDIPMESIKAEVIDYSMVALEDTVLGDADAAVLKPLPDKIRELRDQIFTTAGALSPMAAQNDPAASMQADAARVRVLNGTFAAGLEITTANYLLSQGLQVTEARPADGASDGTVLVLYSPKLYTLKYLQALFGVASPNQIWIRPDPTSTVDVEVRLGRDWANNNPMP